MKLSKYPIDFAALQVKRLASWKISRMKFCPHDGVKRGKQFYMFFCAEVLILGSGALGAVQRDDPGDALIWLLAMCFCYAYVKSTVNVFVLSDRLFHAELEMASLRNPPESDVDHFANYMADMNEIQHRISSNYYFGA